MLSVPILGHHIATLHICSILVQMPEVWMSADLFPFLYNGCFLPYLQVHAL